MTFFQKKGVQNCSVSVSIEPGLLLKQIVSIETSNPY